MVYLYLIAVAFTSGVLIILLRRIRSGSARDYLITASALLLVGSVMTWFVCVSCRQSLADFIYVSLFISAMWIAIWLGNASFSDWISEKVSWTERPLKMFFILLVFTVSYTLGAVYLIVVFYRYVLKFNIEADSIISQSLIITFLISMFMHGRSFLLSWKQSAIDAEKAKHESMTAKYESLKNQVNPHFLFNSLNALTNLVYENQDMAAKFIKQLSEVYRYVLDTRDRELVSEQEELKFLESYIFLQQIRFGDNLQIDVTMDGEPTSFPPLVLQMLIENAIKHNEVSAEHPLTIRIRKEDGHVVVENNMRLKTSANPDSKGIGLDNIINRYEFLSSSNVQVKNEGGKFVVILPIIASHH